MAIFSDGTTDLTITADEQYKPQIEKTTKRTAGGNLRSITSGERFEVIAKIRVTPTEYRSLINLLKNNSNNYYFTPEDSSKAWMSSIYPDITWPLNVNFDNLSRDWDNRGYWYVSMDIEGTSYV